MQMVRPAYGRPGPRRALSEQVMKPLLSALAVAFCVDAAAAEPFAAEDVPALVALVLGPG